jgi:hypothetical protein
VEAGMTRRDTLAVVLCMAVIGCDPDPAGEIKIISRPTGSTDSASNAPPPVIPPFRPELCTVQPEQTPGKTKFVANGPCAFHHEGNVKCRAALDDFHTVLLRQGPGDATVSIYLNIEYYKGAGSYEGGQMFLTVQTGTSYYHWGSDSVKTTVGPNVRYVDVPETRLEAEPPNTGTELVSGRFWCADLNDPKPQ